MRGISRSAFGDMPIDTGKIESIFLSVVRSEINLRIELVAAKNKTETIKLRAFIAGDTLAEILMSQAFLTPM